MIKLVRESPVDGEDASSDKVFYLDRAESTRRKEDAIDYDLKLLTISPDGSYIAIAGYVKNDNNFVLIVDQKQSSILRHLPFSREHGIEISTIAFHPNGNEILIGMSDGTVWFESITDTTVKYNRIRRGTRSDDSISDIVLAPDGKSYAHKRALWPTCLFIRGMKDKGKTKKIPVDNGKIRSFSFSPDSKSIVVLLDNGLLTIWDVETETLTWQFQSNIFHQDRVDVDYVSEDEILLCLTRSACIIRVDSSSRFVHMKRIDIPVFSNVFSSHISDSTGLITFLSKRKALSFDHASGEQTQERDLSLSNTHQHALSRSGTIMTCIMRSSGYKDSVLVTIVNPETDHVLDDRFV